MGSGWERGGAGDGLGQGRDVIFQGETVKQVVPLHHGSSNPLQNLKKPPLDCLCVEIPIPLSLSRSIFVGTASSDPRLVHDSQSTVESLEDAQIQKRSRRLLQY